MARQRERLNEILSLLDQLAVDPALPRKVCEGARVAKERLLVLDEPLDLQAATVNSILDDLANDPEVPLRWRKKGWPPGPEVGTTQP
jgi:uncharacterized protein (UPF0147 family)